MQSMSAIAVFVGVQSITYSTYDSVIANKVKWNYELSYIFTA